MKKEALEEAKPDYSALRVPVTIAVFSLWSLFLIEGRRFVEAFSPFYLTLAGVVLVTLLSQFRSSAFKESPLILPSVLWAAWLMEEFIVGKGANLSEGILVIGGTLLFVGLFSIIMELDSPSDQALRGGDAHRGCLLSVLLALLGAAAIPASHQVLRAALHGPGAYLRPVIFGLALLSLGASLLFTRRHERLKSLLGIWSVFFIVYPTTLLLLSWFTN